MPPTGGPNAPLPPWLKNGRPAARSGGLSPTALRGPALLIAGALIGWFVRSWQTPPPAPAPPPVVAAALQCPEPAPCRTDSAATPAHAARPPTKKFAHPLALHPLPSERPATEEDRREALRAFAQARASDLRDCLGDPNRGPLRRIGAALEIDSHGAVAAVQILGGEGSSRELDSCYSARLRSWRFPQALLQGDERLLVNFVL
jgi:hypothetical protein